MTTCNEWPGVDMPSFTQCDVWGRADLFQALLHLGPLAGQGSPMGEVAWTAEFGLLGITNISAERTSERDARVAGDLLTAPLLRITLDLLVAPGCAGDGAHHATRLHVAAIETTAQK